MRRWVLAAALVCAPAARAMAGSAPAATVDPAEERFRAALARRGAGDLDGAANDFARLADEAPTSPWADDARMEAALAAEMLGEYARAHRELERLLVDHPDSRLATRARARLDQIAGAIGADGQWAAAAAEHDAIARDAARGGDPAPAFTRLEALIRSQPGYPRAHDARMWLGDGWLRQGAWDRALASYRDAVAHAPDPQARFRAAKAVGDLLLTRGDLDDAAAAYRALRGQVGTDAEVLHDAFASLDLARTRARRARWAWVALGVVALVGAAVLRRDAGSWRRVLGALARPPAEVLYFAPVATLLVLASLAGNRIVAHAVQWLALAGLALAWGSGVCLEVARRRGTVGAGRVLAHVAAAAIAVMAAGYLVAMDDRLLDMLVETWTHGHDRH